MDDSRECVSDFPIDSSKITIRLSHACQRKRRRRLLYLKERLDVGLTSCAILYTINDEKSASGLVSRVGKNSCI